jgi:hypothetical protein
MTCTAAGRPESREATVAGARDRFRSRPGVKAGARYYRDAVTPRQRRRRRRRAAILQAATSLGLMWSPSMVLTENGSLPRRVSSPTWCSARRRMRASRRMRIAPRRLTGGESGSAGPSSFAVIGSCFDPQTLALAQPLEVGPIPPFPVALECPVASAAVGLPRPIMRAPAARASAHGCP